MSSRVAVPFAKMPTILHRGRPVSGRELFADAGWQVKSSRLKPLPQDQLPLRQPAATSILASPTSTRCPARILQVLRSEERRVGDEWLSTCGSRLVEYP